MAVPLITAATAAAARAAPSRRSRGLGGRAVAATIGGGKDRKLDRGLLARALGAGYFLLLVDDDLLEAGLAGVAQIFVDGHGSVPLFYVRQGDYSRACGHRRGAT